MQEDLSDLDILKNAVKDYVKDNKQFPTNLWEEIKDNHPKTFRIDQSTINLMMWACAASNNLRHGMVIVSELAKLKRGKKHISDEMKLAAYNSLLFHCEKQMTAEVEAGGAKDTGLIMEVLDEVNNAGLIPNDTTIEFLRRNMCDGGARF